MVTKISLFVSLVMFCIFGNIASSSAMPMIEGSQVAHVKQVDTQKKDKFKCKNKLAQWIYGAGFRGHNIKEAWAIAMRESNGIPSTVSGNDYGLFQFNYGAWGNKLDWNRILDPEYNAKAAYKLSKGGKSWIPWGMRDHREWDNASYAGIWSDDQFYAWVIEPYDRYYAQFPCKI